MKNKWIGTGWKMNHLLSDAMAYTDELMKYVSDEKPSSNIFICVPFTVLHSVADKLTGSSIHVASQNVHWLEKGAATGEISPLMVRDAGACMVEIGHSERRSMFAETDKIVNAKVIATLQNGMRPLVCVGETSDDKAMDVAIEKLIYQIKVAFHGIPASEAGKILLAYEPVWAIGKSGSPAKPEYADWIHKQFRNSLQVMFGEKIGSKIPILYGGSVNQSNAIDLISMQNIDGLFIGRAAWEVDGFISIIRMVEDYTKEYKIVQ